jgi:plastocyanin
MTTDGSGGSAAALGWQQVAVGAAILTIVVIVITAFIAEIVLLLISAALLAVGAALTRKPGRAGLIVLAVVAFLLLVTDGPFVIPYLAVPTSWINFILISLLLLGSAVIVIAAVAAIRKGDQAGSKAPRAVAVIAGALAVVTIGVAVGARSGYTAPTPRSGDVRLTAHNVEFSTASLKAQAGTVSVFVTNDDTVLHTFTIDKLSVNLNVPANSTARVSVRAAPGRYPYLCTLHTNMRGILTVE